MKLESVCVGGEGLHARSCSVSTRLGRCLHRAYFVITFRTLAICLDWLRLLSRSRSEHHGTALAPSRRILCVVLRPGPSDLRANRSAVQAGASTRGGSDHATRRATRKSREAKAFARRREHCAHASRDCLLDEVRELLLRLLPRSKPTGRFRLTEEATKEKKKKRTRLPAAASSSSSPREADRRLSRPSALVRRVIVFKARGKDTVGSDPVCFSKTRLGRGGAS